VDEPREEGARPPTDLRIGLAAAIMALYGSIAITQLVLPSAAYQRIYDQIGFTRYDLPVPTQAILWFGPYFKTWWWAGGVIFLALAGLAWKGCLGNRRWKSIVAVMVMTVGIPGLTYLALEMPIIKLKQTLDGLGRTPAQISAGGVVSGALPRRSGGSPAWTPIGPHVIGLG